VRFGNCQHQNLDKPFQESSVHAGTLPSLGRVVHRKIALGLLFTKKPASQNELQALDQYEANTLKTQAIEIYQRIVTQYPEFDHLDKVYFFMAHEYHELGRTDEMIAQYRILLKKFPQSVYAPESHLLLGDYHFNQKQDVDASTNHYQAVLGTQKPGRGGSTVQTSLV
jgi:tetratricopeptide (TPR) repeat protein